MYMFADYEVGLPVKDRCTWLCMDVRGHPRIVVMIEAFALQVIAALAGCPQVAREFETNPLVDSSVPLAPGEKCKTETTELKQQNAKPLFQSKHKVPPAALTENFAQMRLTKT